MIAAGKCFMSVFSLDRLRFGGTEIYCRELSRQLNQIGWTSVLCFEREPPPVVRSFLKVPNMKFEQVGNTRVLDGTNSR